ncbi:MAG: GTP-binding protein, partial [Thermales bacterium]|nr:GTP-binding protein [Thermales bacterium]
SSGISEPLPVAQTFTFEDENGEILQEIARLDTLVTVVDGSTVMESFEEGKNLKDVNQQLDESDERSVSNLLTDQIEWVDVLLISKPT